MLQRNLQLQAGGKAVTLTIVPNSVELSFPPGQGGLSIMRLSAWFTTALSFSGGQPLTINNRDNSYRDIFGWREIVVRTGDGISLLESKVHTRESSDELRTYPQDMLSSLLNDREAKLKMALSGSPASSHPASRPICGWRIALSFERYSDSRHLHSHIHSHGGRHILSYSPPSKPSLVYPVRLNICPSGYCGLKCVCLGTTY